MSNQTSMEVHVSSGRRLDGFDLPHLTQYRSDLSPFVITLASAFALAIEVDAMAVARGESLGLDKWAHRILLLDGLGTSYVAPLEGQCIVGAY